MGFPIVALVNAVIGNMHDSQGLFDFRIYRHAGIAVLHGHSPYISPQSILAGVQAGFVYPAPAAWVMVPFGLMPFQLAAVCFTLITTGAVVATLWVLGVRDLRCYTLSLFMMPVSTGITTGTVSTLLTCAAALVWRYRDRVLFPALALAFALMLKPLLWPVAIWLAATRRWRAAVGTLLVSAVGTAAGYAALHINGLESYPALVRATTSMEAASSYSLYGLLSQIGAPFPLVLSYVIGAAMLVGVWLVRRDERLSFELAIIATLALTPIVWVHYFSLLLVPLALGSRRLSWSWALPVLIWLANGGSSPASPINTVLVWWLAMFTLVVFHRQGRTPGTEESYRRGSMRARALG
ncbi:MAG TPA: glycosyltransferase family 87 protein [Gaiellaceae bacterium]